MDARPQLKRVLGRHVEGAMRLADGKGELVKRFSASQLRELLITA